MATVNPRGFVASRHLTSGTTFTTVMRPTLASNTVKIFAGDPVIIDANGKIQRVAVTTPQASASSTPWLGIVAAVYLGNEKPRPFTHYQPDRELAIPVSTTGWVQVYEDPFIIYTVNCSVSMSAPQIGRYVTITSPTANSALGWSRTGIDGTDTSAAAIGRPLRIVRVSQRDPTGPTLSDNASNANNDVEVIIARHFWLQAGPFSV